MLSQRNIVIIGGTSGIGLGAALTFIEVGAKVVVVGLDEDTCSNVEKEFGSNGLAICGDARQEGIAELAIENCIGTFGGFDGLYHVAGGSGRKWGDGKLHELSLTAWNETIDLNLTSVMLSNRAAVQTFLKNNVRGTILNLSSVLSSHPSPKYFATHAYATAKSAIDGFTRAIAAHYAPYDIRVNAIAPSLVQTPMSERARSSEEIMSFVRRKQPLAGGRIGQVDDLNGLACYFMSEQSAFTTGQVIAIDGGWSLSDGFIE